MEQHDFTSRFMNCELPACRALATLLYNALIVCDPSDIAQPGALSKSKIIAMKQNVPVQPQIMNRSTVEYAGVRERLRRDRLADVVPRSIGEVAEFLQRHQIAPTGAPLVRYLVVDYNTNIVEIEVGLPVARFAPPHDRVRLGDIPAGRYATVTHRGSYDTLVDTTAALLEWGKLRNAIWQMTEQENVTQWGARVERYDVGPPAEPDPIRWRTEIAILLAA
jgi:effector-binding domain-containing protein